MAAALARVAVLMASYNGAAFIAEQMDSILSQTGVAVHVFVSDDGSSDDTLAILSRYPAEAVTLLPPARSGGAGQNFLRLLRDAPWQDFDFVAFSDQDDIWHPGKLARGTARLMDEGYDAYSSNVTAFWPDGRRKLVDKAQARRRLDYLFEAPGPGHTFILTRDSAALVLDRLVAAGPDKTARVALHDWLIYAILGAAGRRWLIDPHPSVDYRLHGNNVIGTGRDWATIRKRLSMLMGPWYRDQIVAIADVAQITGPEVDFMRAPRLWRLPHLLAHMTDYRRKRSEAAVLAAAFLVMAATSRHTDRQTHG